MLPAVLLCMGARSTNGEPLIRYAVRASSVHFTAPDGYHGALEDVYVGVCMAAGSCADEMSADVPAGAQGMLPALAPAAAAPAPHQPPAATTQPADAGPQRGMPAAAAPAARAPGPGAAALSALSLGLLAGPPAAPRQPGLFHTFMTAPAAAPRPSAPPAVSQGSA